MTVSPSALAAWVACPLSAARGRAGAEPPDPEREDGSAIGRAVHAVLARVAAATGTPGIEDVTAEVRRIGLPPPLVDAAVQLALVGRRILLHAGASGLAVEREAEIALGGGRVLAARLDAVRAPRDCDERTGEHTDGALARAEVWDWKTEARLPPDPDELARDPQVCAALVWARYAYPDAPAPVARWVYLAHEATVTVRYEPGMAAYLDRLVREHDRERGLPLARQRATTGRPCARCAHRSDCGPRRDWLAAGDPSPIGDDADMAAIAEAYRDAGARAKAWDAARRDAGARLLDMLGAARTAKAGERRVTRVRRRLPRWGDGAVAALAAEEGRPVGEVWADVGEPRPARMKAAIERLDRSARERVVAESEERHSEHVRVT